jgi:putative acetyltransferase
MKNRNWKIRSITAHDDSRVAYIIRSVMPEFGADGDGFAIHDAEVDWMSKAYNAPRSAYYVVELEGQVLGGGGIAPLEGATNPRICELRKMYFLPALRGLGAGQALLDTVVGMDSAMALYQKAGFRSLDKPMGDTGHGGCNRFYAKSL